MLMAMGMLEADRGSMRPSWNHLAIEAMKTARSANATRISPIRRFTTAGSPPRWPPPSLPRCARRSIRGARGRRRALPDRGDTIFLCVVDEHGGAVSLIESLFMNFGSGIVAEGTGVVLHNRGSYFSVVPGHPNVYAGGKRPLHTLSPPMVLRDGRPELVFGTMGGDGQPQIQVQLLHQIYDRGINVQQALDMPRWIFGRHTDRESNRHRRRRLGHRRIAHGSRPSSRPCANCGHLVHEIGPYCNEMGHAHAIAIDSERGTLAGGGDPRADSLALGY